MGVTQYRIRHKDTLFIMELVGSACFQNEKTVLK